MAAQVGDMIVERGGRLVVVAHKKGEKLSGYCVTGIVEKKTTTEWREAVTREVEVKQDDDSKKREKRTVYETRKVETQNAARWLQSFPNGEFDEHDDGSITRRVSVLSSVGKAPSELLAESSRAPETMSLPTEAAPQPQASA